MEIKQHRILWGRDKKEVVEFQTYHDADLVRNLETILPHDKITPSFPELPESRGVLNPFIFIWISEGYCGLNREGYNAIRAKIPSETRIFIQKSFDEFLAREDRLKPYLEARVIEGKDVYFPTEKYVQDCKDFKAENSWA